ncbi:MAG: invasion associated locus B family protein [Gammaproteobacteria bacterium]|nr:invasion associated locus B family protein [Gammaproteobacteria bacterium]
MLVACLLLLGGALPLHAEDQHLGSFRDWSAVKYSDRGELTCMLFSQPKQMDGKDAGVTNAFVFVTYRYKDGALGEGRVSVQTAYSIKDQTQLQVVIDKDKLALTTSESTAWTTDAKEDAALIGAMRAGHDMMVVATDQKGQQHEDVYSLLGFTAAGKALESACKP